MSGRPQATMTGCLQPGFESIFLKLVLVKEKLVNITT